MLRVVRLTLSIGWSLNFNAAGNGLIFGICNPDGSEGRPMAGFGRAVARTPFCGGVLRQQHLAIMGNRLQRGKLGVATLAVVPDLFAARRFSSRPIVYGQLGAVATTRICIIAHINLLNHHSLQSYRDLYLESN